MRVLIACEFSGVVREAFRARGHSAYSCDLLYSDSRYHLQHDVLEMLEGWDMMIAFPPCTYLCNSGVRWLEPNAPMPSRYTKMLDGAGFFKKLLEAPIPQIAVENPIMHKYARWVIGQNYDQIIQPWQFGHGETKATCLWLKNLPKLVPTNIVEGREARIHREPPHPDRWKRRSITYQGIADAMAEQWGHHED